MRIERTEPQTGGQHRTERREIVPVFGASDRVEPRVLFDLSGSESWEVAPPEGSEPSRWSVQRQAMRELVGAAESLDSQAAGEQASGSDEKGGLYAAGFNHGLLVVGQGNGNAEEDDDGDLNTSNFDRKIDAMLQRYGVPDGGTCIMPALRYLDAVTLKEFSEEEETGLAVPVAQRPAVATAVFTDGELDSADASNFYDYLSHAERRVGVWWPREEWFVAILGHGRGHDTALEMYRKIAAAHTNVHVYSFDRVRNGSEIAEDMAVAMLPQG